MAVVVFVFVVVFVVAVAVAVAVVAVVVVDIRYVTMKFVVRCVRITREHIDLNQNKNSKTRRTLRFWFFGVVDYDCYSPPQYAWSH